MHLGELQDVLDEIKDACTRLGEVWQDVPIRIYGENGEPRKIEFDAGWMTAKRDIRPTE